MKSSLFEYYKKKYTSGGNIPVSKTGMWYQDGDVVVPSNQITMKGPNGEKDYFDSPILGTGVLSGETQIMEPGKDYTFPKDNAVLEKKMQQGAKVSSTEMTPEQQARLNAYIRGPQTRSLNTPNWLDLSSGATDYARRLSRMSPEEMITMPGDISSRVADAFKSGIDYSIDYNLPNDFGRITTEGNYNPFAKNTLQDMYSGLTYNKSFPKGSVKLTPTKQEFTLRGKDSNARYKREMTDDEVLSQLSFDFNVLPQALNLYGEGSIKDLGVSQPQYTNNIINYENLRMNPRYNISGGLRGNIGGLSYDVSGNYNPNTGYGYNVDADLSLLKDKLNLSGNLSGSQENGLESMSAKAKAKLFKNLNLEAGYKQSKDQPGNFNLGLNYNQFFQGGGMSIPGVNGTVVAAPMSIRESYKRKKKK